MCEVICDSAAEFVCKNCVEPAANSVFHCCIKPVFEGISSFFCNSCCGGSNSAGQALANELLLDGSGGQPPKIPTTEDRGVSRKEMDRGSVASCTL